MTDDQTLASFGPRTMPFTWRLMREEGTVFTQAVGTPPLCCPSRAGFLTGQYPHNHGVDANVPGYGLLRDKEAVLPVWLQRAGYRTAFIGKYLNEYERTGGTQAAPGWDEWFANLGYPAYFDYEVSDDGERVSYGSGEEDYSTSVFADRAVEFVSREGEGSPFFLWLALNAPHIAGSGPEPCGPSQPQAPTPEAFEEFAGDSLPRPPSFDELDTSDKPGFIRDLPPLSAETVDLLTLRWRCGAAALRAADAAMERLVASLGETGQLERTILVFTSDNGYFFGEHRLDDDKRLPYEPSLRVPLAMRVPSSLVAGERIPEVDRLVANIDLAPTLLDFAEASACPDPQACGDPDGISLRPLLSGEDGPLRDRAVLVELDDGFTYAAIRTQRYLYSELSADRTGALPEPEIELYDLRSDPFELHNLWAEDPGGVAALQSSLAQRLDRMRSCSGARDCAAGSR